MPRHSLSGGYKAVSGDFNIGTANISSGILKVTGKKAGVLMVFISSSAGSILPNIYQIYDPDNLSQYTLLQGGEIFFSGPGAQSKPVPVRYDAPANPSGVTWSSMNESVATVDPTNGVITPKNIGACIVVGSFTDEWGVGREIHVLVGVGAQSGVDDLSVLHNLIQQGQAILGQQPATATTASLNALQNAVNQGSSVIGQASPSGTDVQMAIADLMNAIGDITVKSNITVTLSQPNLYDKIPVGITYDDNSVAGGYKAVSGDFNIGTANISSGILKVTGKKAGVLMVGISSSAGSILPNLYQIYDPDNLSQYTLLQGGEIYFSGPGDQPKPVPVRYDAPANPSGVTWSSMNENVATVDPITGVITPKNIGACIVVGSFTDEWGVGREIHVLVKVGV